MFAVYVKCEFNKETITFKSNEGDSLSVTYSEFAKHGPRSIAFTMNPYSLDYVSVNIGKLNLTRVDITITHETQLEVLKSQSSLESLKLNWSEGAIGEFKLPETVTNVSFPHYHPELHEVLGTLWLRFQPKFPIKVQCHELIMPYYGGRFFVNGANLSILKVDVYQDLDISHLETLHTLVVKQGTSGNKSKIKIPSIIEYDCYYLDSFELSGKLSEVKTIRIFAGKLEIEKVLTIFPSAEKIYIQGECVYGMKDLTEMAS